MNIKNEKYRYYLYSIKELEESDYGCNNNLFNTDNFQKNRKEIIIVKKNIPDYFYKDGILLSNSRQIVLDRFFYHITGMQFVFSNSIMKCVYKNF